MKLEVYHDANGFTALRDEWNGLVCRNATNEIFLTWEWQSIWWAVYQPGDLWLIAARDDQGTLVGIASWFLEQPSRKVRSVGCVDVTDYLDLIVLPDQREAFIGALAAWLAEQSGKFVSLNLCNIQEQSPTLEALPRHLMEQGFSLEIKPQDTCPHILLPASFEDYLNGLDKKNRHEMRRKMRRAEDSDEQVAWYLVTGEHDLTAEIERFVTLMMASHPDKARFMEDAQNAAFFRAIVPALAHCGWLQVAFLTVQGQPAAAYLNFDYDNRICVYNSGLMPHSYAHLSPGIVLLGHLIQHAIDQGRADFDFLRGNEDYKYRLGAKDAAVMELRAVLQQP